jgi:hypothetical protein
MSKGRPLTLPELHRAMDIAEAADENNFTAWRFIKVCTLIGELIGDQPTGETEEFYCEYGLLQIYNYLIKRRDGFGRRLLRQKIKK